MLQRLHEGVLKLKIKNEKLKKQMITAIRMAFSSPRGGREGAWRGTGEVSRLAYVLHSRHGRLDR